MGRLTDKIVKVYNIEGYHNQVYDEGVDKQYEFRLNVSCVCSTKTNSDEIAGRKNSNKLSDIFKVGDIYDMYSVNFNEFYSPEFAYAFDQFLDIKPTNKNPMNTQQYTFRDLLDGKEAAVYIRLPIGKDGDFESRLAKFLERHVPVTWKNNFKITHIVTITLFRTSYLDGGMFEQAMNIASKTVGADIVPVQPMDSPVGKLMFMDYV